MNCEFLLPLDEVVFLLYISPLLLAPLAFTVLTSAQNDSLSRVEKLRHGHPTEEDQYQTREL
jgi:hypothetical protein